jgi:hypothetical protein
MLPPTAVGVSPIATGDVGNVPGRGVSRLSAPPVSCLSVKVAVSLVLGGASSRFGTLDRRPPDT